MKKKYSPFIFFLLIFILITLFACSRKSFFTYEQPKEYIKYLITTKNDTIYPYRDYDILRNQFKTTKKISGLFYYFYDIKRTKIRITCPVINGYFNGTMIYYRTDGTISTSRNYLNGLFNGPEITYNKEGCIVSVIYYKNGESFLIDTIK